MVPGNTSMKHTQKVGSPARDTLSPLRSACSLHICVWRYAGTLRLVQDANVTVRAEYSKAFEHYIYL